MEICLQSAQHVVLRCSRSRERCVDAGNSPRLCVGGCPNCFPLLFPAGHCSLATIDTNTKYTKNTNTKKLNTQIQKLCGWRPPNCFPLVFPAGHWCPQPYICHCCCITSQVSFTICSPVTCHWLALTLLLNSVNSKNITFYQLRLMFLHSDMVLEIVKEKTNQLCCCLILFKTLVFALISISQQLMCELSAGKHLNPTVSGLNLIFVFSPAQTCIPLKLVKSQNLPLFTDFRPSF